jgi:hypothetical protein
MATKTVASPKRSVFLRRSTSRQGVNEGSSNAATLAKRGGIGQMVRHDEVGHNGKALEVMYADGVAGRAVDHRGIRTPQNGWKESARASPL